MTPQGLLELIGGRAPETGAPSTDLGDILLHEGVLTPDDLDLALARQAETGDPLAAVLIAQDLASADHVAEATARQRGLGHADLVKDPPDPAACDRTMLEVYLEHRIIPWRKVGNLVCYATADPDSAPAALVKLAPVHAMAFVVVASQRAIDQALLDLMPREAADRAATLTPADMSVRALDTWRHGLVGVMALFALAVLAVPKLALAIMASGLFLMNTLTAGTRLAAVIASLERPKKPPDDSGTVILARHRPLPKLSILIPLYDEAAMVPKLVRALTASDYPPEKLDVKLLLEESDTATRDAARQADLPPWVSTLVLPDGQPRTKPRAMNLALEFCDGDVVGILDAEDQPDPGQFRAVAEHLASAHQEVACVQCQLSWFNARETWITRCFQIEYSIWFDVLLRGFQHLGLPIPLGGTSVYFRKSALRNLGGWDAHNVTEDADLGMRLARRGLRTDVLTSTTQEEANTRVLPWIRQRSRWLKGYLMTWLCHMRAPAKLWRDLGPLGFVGLNILFLGGAVTYLAMPIFWIALSLSLTTGQPVFGDAIGPAMHTVLAVGFGAGQAVMLGCAALALWRRRALDLLLWLPILPVYWTLGAVAAWKAIVEVGAAPFYWDKTRHGVSRCSAPDED